MKINIANPATGASKLFDIDEEKKYRIFYDKKIGEEVAIDSLGDQFKGYVVRIRGGLDKQGFAMMPGVLTTQRVRLLLKGGSLGFYRNRRVGDRRRKSIRGCIVSQEISALNVILVKKGQDDLDGVTNKVYPHRLGPKRVGKIRKFFGLSKKEDVRKYVVKVPVPPKKEGLKETFKTPKIQRLVTGRRIRHKRRVLKLQKERIERSRKEKMDYINLVKKIREEKRAVLAGKRSKSSPSSATGNSNTAKVVQKPKVRKNLKVKKTSTLAAK